MDVLVLRAVFGPCERCAYTELEVWLEGQKMKKHALTLWLSIWFLFAACLLCAGVAIGPVAAHGATGERPDTDARLDLVRALQATRPHPSIGDHAGPIGRLIGTWDVAYTDFSKSGKVTHRTGELIFGWVMDGRVVQDLWIVDPSAAGKEREVYTDLFYFDPESGAWHTAFVDPEHPSVARFTGSAAGDDRIVLESRDLGANDTRWSYYDIRADSFVYRAEESSDGGRTWTLQSEYHMKRRRGGAPASEH